MRLKSWTHINGLSRSKDATHKLNNNKSCLVLIFFTAIINISKTYRNIIKETIFRIQFKTIFKTSITLDPAGLDMRKLLAEFKYSM